jgi:hypothetical protein
MEELPYSGGAIHKKKKGKHTKSITHPGELNFTTKKGDRVHHIGGHDIYGLSGPYSGGAMIASIDLADGIRGGNIRDNLKKYGKYALGGLGAAAGIAGSAYLASKMIKKPTQQAPPQPKPTYQAPPPTKPSSDHNILGVSPGASKDEIRSAYKKQSRLLHPDKNIGNPNAAANFQNLHNAYERLYGGKMRRFGFRKKKH